MLCRSEPCKYHGWLQLVEWCRHPDHVEPLEPNRNFAMMASGGRCPNLVDWEAKVMPGAEPRWPMPVDIKRLIAAIAITIPIGYKNDEKSAKNES